MLSLPNDWVTYGSWIQEHGKEGRESIQGAIKEPEAAGYLNRMTIKNDNGKIIGLSWQWRDTPPDGFPSDGKPAAGFSACTKNPSKKENNTQRNHMSASHEAEIGFVFENENMSQEPPPSTLQGNRPSCEEEFNFFVESEELTGISEYRPNLYNDLTKNNWCLWDGMKRKWNPIVTWHGCVERLNTKILNDKTSPRKKKQP